MVEVKGNVTPDNSNNTEMLKNLMSGKQDVKQEENKLPDSVSSTEKESLQDVKDVKQEENKLPDSVSSAEKEHSFGDKAIPKARLDQEIERRKGMEAQLSQMQKQFQFMLAQNRPNQPIQKTKTFDEVLEEQATALAERQDLDIEAARDIIKTNLEISKTFNSQQMGQLKTTLDNVQAQLAIERSKNMVNEVIKQHPKAKGLETQIFEKISSLRSNPNLMTNKDVIEDIIKITVYDNLKEHESEIMQKAAKKAEEQKKIVSLKGTETPGGTNKPGHNLSAAQLAICKKMRINPEVYAQGLNIKPKR